MKDHAFSFPYERGALGKFVFSMIQTVFTDDYLILVFQLDKPDVRRHFWQSCQYSNCT